MKQVLQGDIELTGAIKVDDTNQGSMRRQTCKFGIYQDSRLEWYYYIRQGHGATLKYSGRVKSIINVLCKNRMIVKCRDGRNITIDPLGDWGQNELVSLHDQLQHILHKAGNTSHFTAGQMPTPNPAHTNKPTISSSPPNINKPSDENIQSSPIFVRRQPQKTSPPQTRSPLTPTRLMQSTAKSEFPSRSLHMSPDDFKSERLHAAGIKSGSFYNQQSASLPRNYGMFRSTVRRPGLLNNPFPRKSLSNASSYTWKSPSLTPSERSQPLQGFSNLGNTCYMNAILQSLFGLDTFAMDITKLTMDIRKKFPDVPSDNKLLFSALHKLVLAKRKNNVSYEVQRQLLSNVKNTISAKAKRFSGHDQHDAHEFLCQVLDQLKEEVQKITKNLTSQLESQGQKEGEGQLEAKEDTGNLLINPTIINFEHQVQHTISCLECGAEVTKTESFHDLSLDMPRSKEQDVPCSIQDALDLFFRKEFVDYTCDQCKGQKSEVVHNFIKLPRILVLHLKRYNYTSVMQGKLARRIEIPRFLTLQAQCTEQTAPCFPVPCELPQYYGLSEKENFGKRTVISEETKRRLDFSTRASEAERDSSTPEGLVTPSKMTTSSQTPTQHKFRRFTPATNTSRTVYREHNVSDETLPDIVSPRRGPRTPPQTPPSTASSPSGTYKIDPLSNFTEGDLDVMNEEEQMRIALARSMHDTPQPCRVGVEQVSKALKLVHSEKVRTERLPSDYEQLPSVLDYNKRMQKVSQLDGQNDCDCNSDTVCQRCCTAKADSMNQLHTNTQTDTDSCKDAKIASDVDIDLRCVHDRELSWWQCPTCALVDSQVDGQSDSFQNDLKTADMPSKAKQPTVSPYFTGNKISPKETLTTEKGNGKTTSPLSVTKIKQLRLSSESFAKVLAPGAKRKSSETEFLQGGSCAKRAPGRRRIVQILDDSDEESDCSDSRKVELQSDNKKVQLKNDNTDWLETSFEEPTARQGTSTKCHDTPASTSKSSVKTQGSSSKTQSSSKKLDFSTENTVANTSPSKMETEEQDCVITDIEVSPHKSAPARPTLSAPADDDFDNFVSLKKKTKSPAVTRLPSLANNSEVTEENTHDLFLQYLDTRDSHTGEMEDKENQLPTEQANEKTTAETATETEMSEEEQLRLAMEQSLQDQDFERVQQEEEELRKATEMSLLAFEETEYAYNPDDFGETIERTAEEQELLMKNAKTGDLPYSYKLMSVVCHLGSSSSAGHYVSDVYDLKKKHWYCYDDNHVAKTSEDEVCSSRQKTGYIFFYMCKSLFDDLEEQIRQEEQKNKERTKSRIMSCMSV